MVDEQVPTTEAAVEEVVTAKASKSTSSYNPAHRLVPEHHLLSDEETAEVLAKLGVEKDKLPKIRIDDPAVKYLASIHNTSTVAPVREGAVIKVIRESETAERFVVYRLIIA
ncbi:MAG: DNA-directed RNA polymerase subunit H [archaeon]|nr:DNA-directed RNA polymerase subunit H [archaeon]